MGSIRKGFEESMKTGPLAYYPIESMNITIIDDSTHPLDFDSMLF